MSTYNYEFEQISQKRKAKEKELNNEFGNKVHQLENERMKILRIAPEKISTQIENQKSKLRMEVKDRTYLRKALLSLERKRTTLMENAFKKVDDFIDLKKKNLKEQLNYNLSVVTQEWNAEYNILMEKQKLELQKSKIEQEKLKLQQQKLNLQQQMNNQLAYQQHQITYYPYSSQSNSKHCPKCNSSNLYEDQKGYSVAKGITGAVLTGGAVGLVAGMIGSKKLVNVCGGCGNKW
jgi:hypothetical protein